MSTRKSAYVHCMYAEDIRPEISGQFSIIGVFAGGLKVATVPTSLPKLVVIADVFLPKGELPTSIRVELYRNGDVLQHVEPGPELLRQVNDEPIKPDDDGLNMQVVVGFTGLPINGPGDIRVRAILNDRVLEGNRLKIEVAETSS